MRLATLAALVRRGQLGLLLSLPRLLPSYYRVTFLGTASANGLLGCLAGGPLALERLAADLGLERAAHDGLAAFLDLGVSLGDLAREPAGYRLRSRLARRLSAPAGDAFAALFAEAAELHHAFIAETPARLRAGRRFTLADQRGDVVARSSRTLEPFVGEAIDGAVPARGALRLFEIGCGSGCYIQRAAVRNPELTALGLELQPEVAAEARANVQGWGLAGRVAIEVGDVRARAPAAAFDLATLHNNVYYFPIGERVAVLAHVRGFLVPGGRLLLTTACRGGSASTEILNLWGAMTAGCGPLPTPEEIAAQLGEAGFVGLARRRLIPGERYYAFVATVPAAR